MPSPEVYYYVQWDKNLLLQTKFKNNLDDMLGIYKQVPSIPDQYSYNTKKNYRIRELRNSNTGYISVIEENHAGNWSPVIGLITDANGLLKLKGKLYKTKAAVDTELDSTFSVTLGTNEAALKASAVTRASLGVGATETSKVASVVRPVPVTDAPGNRAGWSSGFDVCATGQYAGSTHYEHKWGDNVIDAASCPSSIMAGTYCMQKACATDGTKRKLMCTMKNGIPELNETRDKAGCPAAVSSVEQQPGNKVEPPGNADYITIRLSDNTSNYNGIYTKGTGGVYTHKTITDQILVPKTGAGGSLQVKNGEAVEMDLSLDNLGGVYYTAYKNGDQVGFATLARGGGGATGAAGGGGGGATGAGATGAGAIGAAGGGGATGAGATGAGATGAAGGGGGGATGAGVTGQSYVVSVASGQEASLGTKLQAKGRNLSAMLGRYILYSDNAFYKPGSFTWRITRTKGTQGGTDLVLMECLDPPGNTAGRYMDFIMLASTQNGNSFTGSLTNPGASSADRELPGLVVTYDDGSQQQNTNSQSQVGAAVPGVSGGGAAVQGAAVQGTQIIPADSASPSTIACTALQTSVPSEDKPVSCSSSGSGVDVTVKRGTDTFKVTLYNRQTKWEGYALVTTATAATVASDVKGVYVYVSIPAPASPSVTCVWHKRDGSYQKVVYTATLVGLSSNLYTYALSTTPAADPVTMEVPNGATGPFAPTQAQIDAAACAALRGKFTGETFECTPPAGAEPTAVTVVRNAIATQVRLYKYTQQATYFWAGYGRSGAASADLSTGAYVKITGAGEVACVWDSDAPVNVEKVVYTSTRTTASSSQVPVVYTLASGAETVTLVHTAGPSPFPPVTPEDAESEKKKEFELAAEISNACKALKAKVPAVQVMCDSTSTVTSTVMVTRGTAVTALVKLYYEAASKSWAGYGLSTGATGAAPKGVYVAVSLNALGVAIVKCVWDSAAAPEPVDYLASVKDRATRTYALVDMSTTGAGKEPTSVMVLSVQSPFPIEQETPKPVPPSSPSSSSSSGLSTEAIVGIVFGVFGFLLIVALVVFWMRSRKARVSETSWY